MTSHAKRLITAFSIIPLLVVIIFRAPIWAFAAVLLAVALISLYEYYALIGYSGSNGITFFSYFLTIALFISILSHTSLPLGLFAFFVIIPLIVSLFDVSKHHTTIDATGKIIMGPFYICLPLALLAMIAMLSQGRMWIFFLLTVIFTGDTGSFYCGRRFGKHKLTRISPGENMGRFCGRRDRQCCLSLFIRRFLLSLFISRLSYGISCSNGDRRPVW